MSEQGAGAMLMFLGGVCAGMAAMDTQIWLLWFYAFGLVFFGLYFTKKSEQ